MGHPPKAAVRHCTETEPPETLTDQHRYFGREDRHQHIDDKWDRGQAREKSNQDQRPTYDLDNTYKRPHHIRIWNADFGESSRSSFSGKQKLLNAFAKKNATHDQADYTRRGRSSRADNPLKESHSVAP